MKLLDIVNNLQQKRLLEKWKRTGLLKGLPPYGTLGGGNMARLLENQVASLSVASVRSVD